MECGCIPLIWEFDVTFCEFNFIPPGQKLPEEFSVVRFNENLYKKVLKLTKRSKKLTNGSILKNLNCQKLTTDFLEVSFLQYKWPTLLPFVSLKKKLSTEFSSVSLCLGVRSDKMHLEGL